MEFVDANGLPGTRLPGRIIKRIVGKDAALNASGMTLGHARYSSESGPMEPHQHAEEAVYVLDGRDAWVRYGPSRDRLDLRVDLTPGTALHIPELEWHVFEWAEDGYADCLVFYGQVDRIRPEDASS